MYLNTTEEYKKVLDKLYELTKNVKGREKVSIEYSFLMKVIQINFSEGLKHGQELGMQKGKEKAIKEMVKNLQKYL